MPRSVHRPDGSARRETSGQTLGGSDRVDESPHFSRVLDTHAGLDAARHVYSEGLELAHDLAHVTRLETACDEYAPRGEKRPGDLPVPRAPRAAALVRRPGVEHDRVGPIVRARDLAVPHLQDLHDRAPHLEAGRLRAMQLEQVEVEVVGDPPRLFRLLVDEDAD